MIDGNANPWTEYHFEDARMVDLGDEALAFSYRASARHAGAGEGMAMFASSVYVNHGGEWTLALHQQTPADTP